MPIPSAARFSIFKMCWNFRRGTSIFFCIFVLKFGHGSLCCSRALSRVIKVSCRLSFLFIKKRYLFLQGAGQHYAGQLACRKSVSGARKLRLHTANLPNFPGLRPWTLLGESPLAPRLPVPLGEHPLCATCIKGARKCA